MTAGLMSSVRAGLAAPERKYVQALASVDADGRFCGYASLFNRMDLAGDIVMPGAFSRTLRARGAAAVGMLLEHDPKASIGAWLRLEEDRVGLWVEGRIGREGAGPRAARLMRSGRLDGLSIGFRTVAAEEDRSARVRRLYEIDLWEVSVVSSPMLPEARARAAGAGRVTGSESPGTAVDVGVIARMRRTTALLRQTR
ncbi:HK97 family phage prohead protease [Acuticoccus sp. M5D2P5]|uniref:HK97 family phage prohead protease n=1 Tax=Acuticoccus kalidii TaxID=2910977 RepID=UPI001F20C9C4|nr:HK97 family phage prohead protease [Acuticoccus kalidii]MCF3934463.1 HK97 family phage prohead protease [Acuticoccus kalidii]